MRAPAARARQRGFFDFSFQELALTFGVALVVLGPKKLPGLVQQLGRWAGRARHMARQFREQLEQEVNSINAVKPVPRNVAPEVGPAAPGTEPAPDPHAAAAASEAGAAAENTTAPPDLGAVPSSPNRRGTTRTRRHRSTLRCTAVSLRWSRRIPCTADSHQRSADHHGSVPDGPAPAAKQKPVMVQRPPLLRRNPPRRRSRPPWK